MLSKCSLTATGLRAHQLLTNQILYTTQNLQQFNWSRVIISRSRREPPLLRPHPTVTASTTSTLQTRQLHCGIKKDYHSWKQFNKNLRVSKKATEVCYSVSARHGYWKLKISRDSFQAVVENRKWMGISDLWTSNQESLITADDGVQQRHCQASSPSTNAACWQDKAVLSHADICTLPPGLRRMTPSVLFH